MWSKIRLNRPAKVIAAALGIAVAAGLGLWLHSVDRTAGETWHSVGTEAPDRIDVFASVQRVDPVAREVLLRVLVVPRGRLGEDDGLEPSADLRLLNSSSLRGDQVFPAHQRISSVDLPIAMSSGVVTDYPLDSYDAKIQFAAVQNGDQVPVLLTLDKVDSLFAVSIRDYDVSGGGGGLDVRFSRSASVLVFATFMMITMWALAIAVLLGARFLVARRRGLVWPGTPAQALDDLDRAAELAAMPVRCQPGAVRRTCSPRRVSTVTRCWRSDLDNHSRVQAARITAI